MKRLLPVVFVFLLAAGLHQAQAKEPATTEILRVNMVLIDGVISLRDFTIGPGALPEQEAVELGVGVVRYVVMDHSGRPMSEGLMPDPAVVLRESVDGAGNVKMEILDSVDVELTLPWDLATHQIRFTKITELSDSAGVQMTRTQNMGAVYVELHGGDE